MLHGRYTLHSLVPEQPSREVEATTKQRPSCSSTKRGRRKDATTTLPVVHKYVPYPIKTEPSVPQVLSRTRARTQRRVSGLYLSKKKKRAQQQQQLLSPVAFARILSLVLSSLVLSTGWG